MPCSFFLQKLLDQFNALNKIIVKHTYFYFPQIRELCMLEGKDSMSSLTSTALEITTR
uniref:Uncharacterized protein n=1 Tax=Macrostomum lignano TaxID=282301 RepID=A0A1I8I3M2_9PLAT